jgi:DNA polymerase-4
MADVPSRIWPLPARKINGIGPKASERLDRLGIHTVGELAAADEELLIRRGQLAASGGAGHR